MLGTKELESTIAVESAVKNGAAVGFPAVVVITFWGDAVELEVSCLVACSVAPSAALAEFKLEAFEDGFSPLTLSVWDVMMGRKRNPAPVKRTDCDGRGSF